MLTVGSIGSAVSTNNGGKEPDNKQMVGFLIGALTGVILLLVAAISFIVFRQRRQKAGQPQPTDDFQIEKNVRNHFILLFYFLLCSLLK